MNCHSQIWADSPMLEMVRASYRTETEEMIDLGDRVVTVICDYARCEPDAPEVALKSAAVWTVREGRIVRVEFYTGGRAEALEAVRLAE